MFDIVEKELRNNLNIFSFYLHFLEKQTNYYKDKVERVETSN